MCLSFIFVGKVFEIGDKNHAFMSVISPGYWEHLEIILTWQYLGIIPIAALMIGLCLLDSATTANTSGIGKEWKVLLFTAVVSRLGVVEDSVTTDLWGDHQFSKGISLIKVSVFKRYQFNWECCVSCNAIISHRFLIWNHIAHNSQV